MEFYAVANHGTAGLGNSFGFAVIEEHADHDDAPKSSQTMTVWGPYATREEAEKEVEEMNRLADEYRSSQE